MGFPRSFQAALWAALILCLVPAQTRAQESGSEDFCKIHDDKAEHKSVNSFFDQNLKEHKAYGFSRALAEDAKRKADAFLDQRILDKRAELCADRLKLAEDIKAAPSRVSGDSKCAGAMIVSLMTTYTNRLATTFDENRHMLGKLRDEHVKALKLKLFEIAKGSTDGVEGTFRGHAILAAPQEIKYEWLKLEATKMGQEAHKVWGEIDPKQNPLVNDNLAIAREAVRAKQERDQAKKKYWSDGTLPAGCSIR